MWLLQFRVSLNSIIVIERSGSFHGAPLQRLELTLNQSRISESSMALFRSQEVRPSAAGLRSSESFDDSLARLLWGARYKGKQSVNKVHRVRNAKGLVL